MLISACTVTDMTTNQPEPLIPVNLDEYRQAIDKAGTQMAAARTRLTNTTEVLRSRVVKAIELGMSESEAARLAGVRRQTVREWLGK
jgi:DNA invertase Pin-like site-specific DNA recombinase